MSADRFALIRKEISAIPSAEQRLGLLLTTVHREVAQALAAAGQPATLPILDDLRSNATIYAKVVLNGEDAATHVSVTAGNLQPAAGYFQALPVVADHAEAPAETVGAPTPAPVESTLVNQLDNGKRK